MVIHCCSLWVDLLDLCGLFCCCCFCVSRGMLQLSSHPRPPGCSSLLLPDIHFTTPMPLCYAVLCHAMLCFAMHAMPGYPGRSAIPRGLPSGRGFPVNWLDPQDRSRVRPHYVGRRQVSSLFLLSPLGNCLT